MKPIIQQFQKCKSQIIIKTSKTFFAFVILLSIFACSKDENPAPENPNAVKFRVKEIRDGFNNSLLKRFFYNAQNLVTEISNEGYTVSSYYEYSPAGYLTVEAYRYVGNPYADLQIDYIYDANNAVIEKKTLKIEDDIKSKQVFTNNAAKLPLTSRHYDYNRITALWVFDESKNVDYTYDANNRLIEEVDNNYRYKYTYDAFGNNIEVKKLNRSGSSTEALSLIEKITNTYNNIKPEYYLNSSLSKNVPLLSEFFTYDDGLLISSSSQTYRYDFNSYNYITKSYFNNSPEFNFVLEQI